MVNYVNPQHLYADPEVHSDTESGNILSYWFLWYSCSSLDNTLWFISDDEEREDIKSRMLSADRDFIDLTIMSSDDDEETRLILNHHGWRYTEYYAPTKSDLQSCNNKHHPLTMAPPTPQWPESSSFREWRKRLDISQYFGPAKKQKLTVDLPDTLPPPLPEGYEAVKEIPGVPLQILTGTHLVLPYDGKIISLRTKRPMGFLQSNGYLQLQLKKKKNELKFLVYLNGLILLFQKWNR